MKIINKLGFAKFKISTSGIPNSFIELDFNPLIETFNLTGNYILIHWQAMPKGHREWGIYSSKDDSYRSVAEFCANFGKVKSLQLEDATAKTVPSAVLYSAQDQLLTINSKTIIGEVTLNDLIT